MRSLIARQGGEPTVVASMREIPLSQNPDAFQFAEALLAGKIDYVVFMTGVGAEALFEAVAQRFALSDLFAALNRVPIAVRGPKPTAVLRKHAIRVDLKAPEPNTWRELLGGIRDTWALAGKTVAVQEYGQPSTAFYDELRADGATVLPVPVYRWALPEDTGPLEDAIRETTQDAFDIVAFTSAQQVDNVLVVADLLGLKDAFTDAVRRTAIVSIGPTCSERLRECGLEPDIEASPPKMGQLVRAALERGGEIRTGKRRGVT